MKIQNGPHGSWGAYTQQLYSQVRFENALEKAKLK